MLTLEMIQDAKKTLEGVARVTPLYESAFINPNANVFIKCENMQVTGSGSTEKGHQGYYLHARRRSSG